MSSVVLNMSTAQLTTALLQIGTADSWHYLFKYKNLSDLLDEITEKYLLLSEFLK